MLQRVLLPVLSIVLVVSGVTWAEKIVDEFAELDARLWYVPPATDVSVKNGQLILSAGDVSWNGFNLSSNRAFSYSTSRRHTVFLADPIVTRDPGVVFELWISGDGLSSATWWNDYGPGLFLGLYPVTENGVVKQVFVALNVKTRTGMAGSGGVTWLNGSLERWPEAIEIIVDGDKFSVQFEGATFVGESIVEEAAIVDGVIQGHYLFDFDKYYFHFGPLNNGDGRGSLVLTGIAIEDLH